MVFECDTHFNYRLPDVPDRPCPFGSQCHVADEWATKVLAQAGPGRGLCVVLGAGAGQLIYQLASRSNLSVVAFDKSITPDIERAIMKSDLGLNPSTAGEVMRIPMPILTEETRKGYTKQSRAEAESARVSVRNARRDALAMLKELLKEKDISEDEERRGHDVIQKLTDDYVAKVEAALSLKETDLMAI